MKNTASLYYPLKESILSILPIVDEFIIALGESDKNDKTKELIDSIKSDKIKIYKRNWDKSKFKGAQIYAEETNFALSKCTGDWCFYIQADEVIHENKLDLIKSSCEKYLKDSRVDGFLFSYYHFYGDYDHYLPFHGWYKNEIRIIRNNINSYSTGDAQSFRKEQNKKLKVIELDAHVYHYGWVRPPHLMQTKRKESKIYYDQQNDLLEKNEFDYGALGKIPVFKISHPEVMKNWIASFFWKNKLNYSKKAKLNREKSYHEKSHYRLLSFLENNLNKGKEFFGYSNWKRIR